MTRSFLFSVTSISSNDQQTFEPLKELTCHNLADSIGIIGYVTESLSHCIRLGIWTYVFGFSSCPNQMCDFRSGTLEVGLWWQAQCHLLNISSR